MHSHLGPLGISGSIVFLLVIGVGLAVVRGVLQVVMAYLPARMSADAMANLRRRLFDVFTDASWSVQASERDGYFQSMSNTHVSSTCQAILAVGAGISAVLMFLTLLASAFALSVITALIIMSASIFLFLMLRPLSRRLRRYARALSAENVEYTKGVQEVVLMAEEIKVFGASASYRKTFYEAIARVRSPLLNTRFLSRAVPATYQSVALLLLIVALWVVSLAGTAHVAELGGVVLILIRSFTYGQQIQSAIASMDELIPFMHRLGDAIDNYASNPQQDGTDELPVIESIALDQVRYSYVPGIEVLHGIDFEARMGEAIGIVGPSGAGKSSIVQLLLRLRDPLEGAVQVNRIDVRSFRRVEWQKHVAYVPQSPQIVWGSVSDNIRFFRPHLDDAAIQQAARRAHIHDEILSWPDGYNTIVGQRASAVSGGQRQRICLARALAGDPDVLILDEPTSALDVKSEMAVQKSLDELRGRVILFLVAHRLSTLSICDRVMVIKDGQLEAIDTPERLLTTNGFYREVSDITRSQSIG
ncbi:MAG: ATP-binding cassette, subfamily multidrug efflux pump [Actinomycetota bacterium]|nr:ATP-binding cassette, subfamily multidrug efflux pump [Actinomycetota bacterium]